MPDQSADSVPPEISNNATPDTCADVRSAPIRGGRAFQHLQRELTSEELANTGTQKLILEILENTERERDDLKEFRTKFYDRDKDASIAEISAKTSTYLDVYFGVGVGLGGTILGFAPTLNKDILQTIFCVGVGLALILGSTAIKISEIKNK